MSSDLWPPPRWCSPPEPGLASRARGDPARSSWPAWPARRSWSSPWKRRGERGSTRSSSSKVLSTCRATPAVPPCCGTRGGRRSEEHTSELQSLNRNSYAVFCFKKKNTTIIKKQYDQKHNERNSIKRLSKNLAYII